jgi:cytochrome P450
VKLLTRLRDGVALLRDPYGFLAAAQREQGPTFWAELPLLGRALFTGDPELVAEIAAHPDLEAGRGIQALRAALGEGSLITLDGSEHLARQRLVAPAFRGQILESARPLVQDAARGLTRELPRGVEFSIYDLVARITRRSIVRLVFGQLDALREREIEAALAGFLGALRSPLPLYLTPLQRDWGSLNGWGRLLRQRRALNRAIVGEVRRHRQQGSPADACTLAALALSDLSAEDLATEVLALLLFGHDTGAGALAWAFVHVHQADAVGRLKGDEAFLEACLVESMRLCPVVAHLTRVARVDLQVGPHRVRAGERVLPSAWLAHHDAQSFPDPERFLPERFLGSQPSPFAYFPFGIGRRLCVGRPFVLRQMIWVLRAVLGEVELRLAPGYAPRPVRKQVLVVPSGGGRFVAASLSGAARRVAQR